ncbi:MAG: U32 family peptidase [Prevotella sp.]|nr:U32 family peptidase [Prevotella sp.]
MTSLELLAPAKNLACGIAAIDHGADAVYIGASRFGARSAAGNSIDDIRQLCEYAYPFGVKVYVTVNTILYDDELDATRQLLHDLQTIGVDAILVQDMAILELSRKEFLPRLHASTQTDNRTPEKVRWLRDLGFSRVVLARELSVEEIAEIHREVPDVELEVFVHGALCVSYSGLCYASQYCFGRSANRGECAQFCRMKFSLVDSEGREVERDRYLLSLKDMNQSNHLLELIEAGATSFKIEGRLKDIGYVKNVTAAYSQRLNEIIRRYPDKYCRSSKGECSYTFTPDLRKTFNRGYTTYFLHGRQPEIASFDTPKAIGEYVGTVKELRGDSFNVAGVTSFANGDGLCFVTSSPPESGGVPVGRGGLNMNKGELVGFRANRVQGNRIWPYRMPDGLRPGVRLYRNNDQEFERLMSRPSAERRIPIRLALRAVADGFTLSAKHMGTVPMIHFRAEHQQAQKPPHENIIRQLSKLGDTIYTCSSVDIPADFNYFIPNSVLSDMRRSLVALLRSEESGKRKEESGKRKENTSAAGSREKGNLLPPSSFLLPRKYDYTYLYNISNHLSQQFYGAKDLSAYELKGGDGPIMQCRHCIRYALGYCVKHGGQRPTWKEPLSLVLGDGRRFRLEFDCKHCQMNVFSMHN